MVRAHQDPAVQFWDQDFGQQSIAAKIADNHNWSLSKDVFRFVEEYVLTTQGASILEAGCGFGKWNIILAKEYPGLNFIGGVDFSNAIWTGHHYLKTLHPKESQRVHFVNGTVSELPFANEQFDALLNLGVIGHNQAADALVRELHRVMKPGAYIFADVVNQTPLALRRKFEALEIFEKFYSPQEFKTLFQNNGFEVKKSYAVDCPFLVSQLLKPPRGISRWPGGEALRRFWWLGLRALRLVLQPLRPILDPSWGFYTCVIAKKK